MKRIALLLIVGLSAAAVTGCGNAQPYVTPERLERGLVIVLTGIEGRGLLNEDICKGLDLGGVDWAIQLEDWTAPVGPLVNLRNERRNRLRAAEIAEQIALYREAYRNRPVVLVGQSGGGAMAVWVAESLPPGQEVDGAILLAAALSPGYPLDRALRKSERGVVNFHSSRDWLLLGVGTTTIGTMDGVHSASAGAKGFTVPDDAIRERLYVNKLHQIPWTEEMSDTGNYGTHLTSGHSAFVATYVAPLVRARRWTPAVIDRVLERGLVEPSRTMPDVKPEPR